MFQNTWLHWCRHRKVVFCWAWYNAPWFSCIRQNATSRSWLPCCSHPQHSYRADGDCLSGACLWISRLAVVRCSSIKSVPISQMTCNKRAPGALCLSRTINQRKIPLSSTWQKHKLSSAECSISSNYIPRSKSPHQIHQKSRVCIPPRNLKEWEWCLGDWRGQLLRLLLGPLFIVLLWVGVVSGLVMVMRSWGWLVGFWRWMECATLSMLYYAIFVKAFRNRGIFLHLVYLVEVWRRRVGSLSQRTINLGQVHEIH